LSSQTIVFIEQLADKGIVRAIVALVFDFRGLFVLYDVH
jgi:hypothetical protein